ncbi:hypothetical protein GCM10022223_51630 [Kineosporia mesophila]|uniref:HTH tetR-type domain-containing protein n=1 Tax=Kineosporia mesophila TaxID=566012 RepID=A0ABP7AAF4_9ACTN
MRENILRAAAATLAAQGFKKSTARAIARTGGFAPGVIYYYFSNLDDLFVATAEYTSSDRFARYRARTEGIEAARDLLDALRQLYREDQGQGHVAAVQELTAAAVSSPRLAEQVRLQTARWQELAENLIRTQIQGQAFESFVPVGALASMAVGAYLGLEMLSHLDGDRSTPEELFAAAEPVAAMIDMLRGQTDLLTD